MGVKRLWHLFIAGIREVKVNHAVGESGTAMESAHVAIGPAQLPVAVAKRYVSTDGLNVQRLRYVARILSSFISRL